MSKILILIILFALIFIWLRRSKVNKIHAVENCQIATEYQKKNKMLVDVIETDSGLQYTILSKGQGTVHPRMSDKVNVHYHCTLIDVLVFDSSVERDKPIDFSLNQVIRGWGEGLQIMVVGDKFRLFIPSKLAYGDRKIGKIPAGSLLIFEVELLSIN